MKFSLQLASSIHVFFTRSHIHFRRNAQNDIGNNESKEGYYLFIFSAMWCHVFLQKKKHPHVDRFFCVSKRIGETIGKLIGEFSCQYFGKKNGILFNYTKKEQQYSPVQSVIGGLQL